MGSLIKKKERGLRVLTVNPGPGRALLAGDPTERPSAPLPGQAPVPGAMSNRRPSRRWLPVHGQAKSQVPQGIALSGLLAPPAGGDDRAAAGTRTAPSH